MLHLTILVSPSNAVFKSECDEIAALLTGPDVDVRVYVQPVTYRVDSDFWLVLADDLPWHEEAMRANADPRVDVSRFVVLHPRGRAEELAEQHRVAAVVDYDGVQAWRAASRALVVRSDIARELPGELGTTAQSAHYASWWPGPEPVSSQLATYLRAFLDKNPRDLTLVRADESQTRGFAAVAIRADTRAAGLIARPFPGGDVLVALSGPPGGVISLIVSNVKDASGELRDVIRESLASWLGGTFEFGPEERAQIAGADRPGLMFYTGAGFQRVGRFGCLVERPGGTVVVSIGVSARSDRPMTVADILENRAIATVLATLEVS